MKNSSILEIKSAKIAPQTLLFLKRRLLRNMPVACRAPHSQLFAETSAALVKMQQGTYGFCEDCGSPIAIKKLVAKPTARYCLHCQQEEENESRILKRGYSDAPSPTSTQRTA